MATTPFGTIYGSQVQTAGDLDVRDVIFRNDYRASTTFSSSHTNYIYNSTNDTTEEATRISQKVDSLSTTGLVELRVRDGTEMTLGVQVQPSVLEFEGADTRCIFTPEGLKFNTDDASIFFGENQEFRIHYDSSTPPRLTFQSYSTLLNDYVTKFSVLNG